MMNQHRPQNTCRFIGLCHNGYVIGLFIQQPVKPRHIVFVSLNNGCNCPRTMDQKITEIAVTSFADSAQISAYRHLRTLSAPIPTRQQIVSLNEIVAHSPLTPQGRSPSSIPRRGTFMTRWAGGLCFCPTAKFLFDQRDLIFHTLKVFKLTRDTTTDKR